ncbi:MAG: hypothetical protein EPN93_01035 [Spirochaetes bacterium]|nr:MAG: hypothetical protein EPN93_01035 [Spirochaetota bacterium]
MKLVISDMSCQHCVTRISDALKGVAGVDTVNITLSDKLVEVTGSAAQSAILDAIKGAGYSPSVVD